MRTWLCCCLQFVSCHYPHKLVDWYADLCKVSHISSQLISQLKHFNTAPYVASKSEAHSVRDLAECLC